MQKYKENPENAKLSSEIWHRLTKKQYLCTSYSRDEIMNQEKFSLLSKIKYPADLRQLSIDQLPQVCQELREDIIDEVSVNPGHFASSLGVVEITVALHYVYDTPEDRIVWDVGHQAYGHKILTGRRDSFCTNRKLHGIRPFPTPLESEYDTLPVDTPATPSQQLWAWRWLHARRATRTVMSWRSSAMVP